MFVNQRYTHATMERRKIVLVGGCRVGKTTIVRAIAGAPDNALSSNPFATVGTSVRTLECTWPRATTGRRALVSLSLWDTDGRRALNVDDYILFSDADAVWFVYDLNDERTFWSAAMDWFRPLKRAATSVRRRRPLIIVFVGTKRDRVRARVFAAGRAVVRRHDAERMAAVFGAHAHVCVAAQSDTASVHRLLLQTCLLIDAAL